MIASIASIIEQKYLLEEILSTLNDHFKEQQKNFKSTLI